jgi:hypothetical protein
MKRTHTPIQYERTVTKRKIIHSEKWIDGQDRRNYVTEM